MNSWQERLGQAEPPGHFVQFYKADEPALNRNVAHFLWDGLLRGDGLLVLGTLKRRESLTSHLERMGVDVPLAQRDGQLVMLDAAETLADFMVNGMPDEERFRNVIGSALQWAKPRTSSAGVRAYGELVGVLWETGLADAAIRVEECWHELLHLGGLTLFCGYPIDVFEKDFQSAEARQVLCAHTHLIPTGPNGDLDNALHLAMDEVLGEGAEELRHSMDTAVSKGPFIPDPERTILWLRENIPNDAGTVLASARQHYETAEDHRLPA